MSQTVSICIPVYNRAQYIAATIESAARQQALEVVVSDNASSDGTGNIVRRCMEVFQRLGYSRHAENLGADANYLSAISLAKGDYCWLLGSDDQLAPDAVDAIAPHLGDADVILVDRQNMNLDFSRSLGVERLLASPDGSRFDCSSRPTLHRYLQSAHSLAGLFSYISSIIVRKAAWDAQPTRSEFLGSAWIHVTKLMDILNSGGTLKYVSRPLVLNRTGNDSFGISLGYVRRRCIDYDYARIARTIFRDDPAAQREILRVLTQSYFNLRMMLSDRRAAWKLGQLNQLEDLRRAYAHMSGTPFFRTKMLIWSAVPPRGLDYAHQLARRARSAVSRTRSLDSIGSASE